MRASSKTLRRFDCIVFDWDGTLFDSTALIVRCIQEAVREVGGTPPTREQAAWVIGLNLLQALAHAAPDVPREKYPALGAAYKRLWAKYADDLSLFDGVLAMLRDLKARGLRLAVATGKSRRGLDDMLRRKLPFDGQCQPLGAWFDATRTADETAGKPHPLMLQEIMAELDVAPQRLLMIGDTAHDMQLARNAGAASVAVSYGAHAYDELASYEPLYIARSVRELHDWLLNNA